MAGKKSRKKSEEVESRELKVESEGAFERYGKLARGLVSSLSTISFFLSLSTLNFRLSTSFCDIEE